MTQQLVNVGAAANDGTGDAVRDAFIKVNANFAEVYGALPSAPPFTSSGGNVKSHPAVSVVGGAGNFGPSTGQSSLEFITVGQLHRIRQAGSITQCKVHLASVAAITGLYLKVWRAYRTAAGASTVGYDLVGQSANLAGSIVVGDNTLTLPTPMPNVKMGDYVGLRVEYSGAAAQNFIISTALNTPDLPTGAPTIVYSALNTIPSASNFNWAAQAAQSGKAVIIETMMAAPIFVAIGDSITSGLEAQVSFIDNFKNTIRIDTAYSEVLSRMTGWSYQNAGVGGDTVEGVAGRFATDVVAKNPKFVVIEVGANNINNPGLTDVSTLIPLYQEMLDACHTAHIQPIIIGVFPFRSYSEGTNLKMQQRDQLNAALKTLVTSPPYNGLYVSPDRMSYHFPGGDPNNLWNVGYAPTDNLHPGPEGHVVIAQMIFDALAGKPDFRDADAIRDAGEGNTSLGVGAQAFDLSGFRNTAVGSYCLYYGTNGFSNTAVGYGAAQTTGYQDSGANNNTAVGYGALLRNQAGVSNTAIGSQALFSNLASNNDAFGANALVNNTTGGQNAAFGGNSLANNVTGSNNTAFGVATLFNNTTANDNTAVGHDALINNTTGFENTAVGSTAGLSTTTGAGNVAIGFNALSFNTVGNSNVAIGVNALQSTNGTGNVGIGPNALADVNGASLNVAIGFDTGRGLVTGTGNTVLGSSLNIPAGMSNSIVLGSNGIARADFQLTNPSLWTFSTPIAAPSAPPATATSAGVAGTVTWDAGFVYVCVAANSWKRAAIAAW